MAGADEVSAEGDGQGADNDEEKASEGSPYGEPYFVSHSGRLAVHQMG